MGMTVPAQKAPPPTPGGTQRRPSAAGTIQEGVMFRSDEDQMMKDAWAKYEKDQQAIVSLTAELCQELDTLKCETQRHKVFRERHSKMAQEHFKKTGQHRRV